MVPDAEAVPVKATVPPAATPAPLSAKPIAAIFGLILEILNALIKARPALET